MEERADVASAISEFITSNNTESTQGSYTASELENIPIIKESADNILLSVLGVAQYPQMPADLVVSLVRDCANVPISRNSSEMKGYHPYHKAVLRAMSNHVAPTPNRQVFYSKKMLEYLVLQEKKFTIPDFIIGSGRDCLHALIPYKVKREGDIDKGLRQSCTYAVEIVRHLIELRRSLPRMTLLCLATDGFLLGVAQVVYIPSNLTFSTQTFSIFASLTADSCLPIHPPSGTVLSAANIGALTGLNALYSLFSATDAQLGLQWIQQTPLASFGINNRFTVTGFLGYGSFATVYRAQVNAAIQDTAGKVIPLNSAVCIKATNYLPRRAHRSLRCTVTLEQEYQILLLVQALNLHCFPVLITSMGCQDTPEIGCPREWIAMENVDIPLVQFIKSVSHSNRNVLLSNLHNFADIVRNGLTAAVDGLVTINVCHTDLRPDNVLMRKLDRNNYGPVIADFGLAVMQNAPVVYASRSLYSMSFFHNQCVRGFSAGPIAARHDHDYFSVAVIAAVILHYTPSKRFQNLPWVGERLDIMPALRTATLAADNIVPYVSGH